MCLGAGEPKAETRPAGGRGKEQGQRDPGPAVSLHRNRNNKEITRHIQKYLTWTMRCFHLKEGLINLKNMLQGEDKRGCEGMEGEGALLGG